MWIDTPETPQKEIRVVWQDFSDHHPLSEKNEQNLKIGERVAAAKLRVKDGRDYHGDTAVLG